MPPARQPLASASGLTPVRSTMPEGDTIYRAAQTLDRALGRRVVTRFESVLPALTRIDDDAPIAGRTVRARVVAGEAPADRVLGRPRAAHAHAHERVLAHLPPRRTVAAPTASGARSSSRPTRSSRSPSTCRSPSSTRPGAGARARVARSGPGPARRVVRRGRRARTPARSAAPLGVGDALLDQRALAGIGNVYKSEVCFVCRINPFTPVDRLSDDDLRTLVRTARRLLQANVAPGTDAGIATYHPLRRTTGRADPRGTAVGVRPRAAPLPPVPDASRTQEAGPGRAEHVLVPGCQGSRVRQDEEPNSPLACVAPEIPSRRGRTPPRADRARADVRRRRHAVDAAR